MRKYRVWTIDNTSTGGVTVTCHTDWITRGQANAVVRGRFQNNGFAIISTGQADYMKRKFATQ